MATTIKCPKCHKDTIIDIAKAVDADAEVYVCNHCKYVFRYVHNPQYAKENKK